MTAPLTIALLAQADAADLLAFERENRAFFARSVPDRGDAEFTQLAAWHAALVEENRTGLSLLFHTRDGAGRIVGRVNISDLREPSRSGCRNAPGSFAWSPPTGPGRHGSGRPFVFFCLDFGGAG